MPGGRRRLANVRKLMRLGREYEARARPRSARLRSIWPPSARRGAAGSSREGEAPVEGEGLDAVRLMTIHRAKGLEFPTVCVADLGRSARPPYEVVRVSADGRLGLRLSRSGCAAACPPWTSTRSAREEREAEEAEERRLFYVAMTRAQERLILSGATRFEGWTAATAERVGARWPGSRPRSSPSSGRGSPRAARRSTSAARGWRWLCTRVPRPRRSPAAAGAGRVCAGRIAAHRLRRLRRAGPPVRRVLWRGRSRRRWRRRHGTAAAARHRPQLLRAGCLRALRLPLLRRARARAARPRRARVRATRRGGGPDADDAPDEAAARRSGADRGVLDPRPARAAELPPAGRARAPTRCAAAARRAGLEPLADGGRGRASWPS